jgi:hypothetical protein
MLRGYRTVWLCKAQEMPAWPPPLPPSLPRRMRSKGGNCVFKRLGLYHTPRALCISLQSKVHCCSCAIYSCCMSCCCGSCLDQHYLDGFRCHRGVAAAGVEEGVEAHRSWQPTKQGQGERRGAGTASGTRVWATRQGRQESAAGVQDIASFEGYKSTLARRILFYTLGVASAGLVFLFARWFLEIKLRLLLQPCHLQQAQYVVVTVSWAAALLLRAAGIRPSPPPPPKAPPGYSPVSPCPPTRVSKVLSWYLLLQRHGPLIPGKHHAC